MVRSPLRRQFREPKLANRSSERLIVRLGVGLRFWQPAALPAWCTQAALLPTAQAETRHLGVPGQWAAPQFIEPGWQLPLRKVLSVSAEIDRLRDADQRVGSVENAADVPGAAPQRLLLSPVPEPGGADLLAAGLLVGAKRWRCRKPG